MYEDEQDLARLLRDAGPRPLPSASAMEDVRRAVEAEWRATVAARNRRRQWSYVAAAAGVAVAAIGLWIARPLYISLAAPIAQVARVEGQVEYRESPDAAWQRVSTATGLRPGAEIRTAAGGKAALQLAEGVDVRMDSGTRLALNDSQRASLSGGAVYVDAGAGAQARTSDFLVETPLGEVRHLGTQYEARLVDAALRVGVREGLVAVRRDGTDVVGNAGEQLLIRGDRVQRSALSATDAQWRWAGDVVPPFDIEGRSLDVFLAWVARETGRSLVYASHDVEQRARETKLSGSVAGLSPDAALEAVLATTELRDASSTEHIRVDAGTP
jgi:ferric-dicitrate binding protein FerR (iron transport regulator)